MGGGGRGWEGEGGGRGCLGDKLVVMSHHYKVFVEVKGYGLPCDFIIKMGLRSAL